MTKTCRHERQSFQHGHFFYKSSRMDQTESHLKDTKTVLETMKGIIVVIITDFVYKIVQYLVVNIKMLWNAQFNIHVHDKRYKLIIRIFPIIKRWQF
jgi:hypothetical protein